MQTRAIQLGVILLSAGLLVTVGIISFSVVKGLTEANLLNETLNTPNSPELSLSYSARVEKGDQLYEAGYYELAATEYSLAVQLESEAEEAYAKLGNTYLKLGFYEKALNNFKRAYELSPGDGTRVNYAIGLLRNKKFEEAKTVLSEGNGGHQGTVFYSAVLDAYLGNYDEAQKELEKAISLSGSVPTAYLESLQTAFQNYNAQQGGQATYLKASLAKAFIDIEEYPMAEELSLQTLNEQTNYRDVWILLGYAQLHMEKYTEAEDAFEQAEKLDAVKPEIHYFLGMAHYYQEEYSEAVDAFELALLYNFEPESEAYRKLAECQNKLGNFEDAVEAYEYLIKIDHSDLSLFTSPLDITLNELDDLDRALTLAQESTSYFPSEALSHTYLAEVYLKRGELEKAQSSIDTAFDIDGDLPAAHYIAGQIRVAQNDIEGAKWEFKKAYELSKPGDALSVKAAEEYNALVLSPVPAP